MKMERKNNELKLPVIQPRTKDSSKVLSNTMPDNGIKMRPASLNKVEDLEKKLFSKLDAYQAVSKKSINKRASRKGKLGESENGISADLQGYQKLQKLMPSLYSKLLEAKKCSTSYEMTPSAIQTPTHNHTPASYKSQAALPNRQESLTSESSRRQEKHVSIFMTSKEQRQEQNQKIEISQEEMNELYQDYIKRQNLEQQTSGKELQDLSQSIVLCQKEIAQLTRSMESLIREIGMECLAPFEEEGAQ